MKQFIIDNLPNILKHNIEDLKKTSEDFSDTDNLQYMTESRIKAINFDKVVTKYQQIYGINNLPKSNDALYITDKNYYFIEFKNGILKNNIANFKGNINGKIKGKVENINVNNEFQGYINAYLSTYFNHNKYINGTLKNNQFNGNLDAKLNGYIEGTIIDNIKSTYIKGNFNGDINANFQGYINYINIETDLKEKIYDSIFILSKISKEFNINIPKISNNIIYVLVYNKGKNSHNRIFKNVKDKAKKNTSILSFPKIDSLKNFILKEVNYLTEDKFENFIEEEFEEEKIMIGKN
ncbi:hypothetical protein [Brachyspira hampsonii]|uniref:hypothetical protein n=1 Tax=Brachyspira hampsonii TaxID=1287055 RepID=UPI000D34812B|nr:hypothetical protein [Brachyspira hampsonii]PTY41311.1 hypothetical protein DQ06_12640 [Brachyspira hampsonii bv. II]